MAQGNDRDDRGGTQTRADRLSVKHDDPRFAPDPEDPRKPDAPTDLTSSSWKGVLKRTFTEFKDDQCQDSAAALTYYGVLALFPAAIAMLSLVGLFGQGQSTTDALLNIVRSIGQENAAKTLEGPLTDLAAQHSKAGFALVIGLVTSLWSASGYVGAFGRAANRIYEVEEGRPFWKLRPLQLLVTLVAVVLAAAVALSLVVTGPVAKAIGDEIGLGSAAVTTWNIAKWPVMALIAALIIALLYYATPNVKQPKFRWFSMGSLLALVVWIVASAAFGFYVSTFSSYNKTYGSLASVIVFLLWLWITNLAVLFGAEFDAELERGRELQAGLPAQDQIQLPPRDVKD